MRQIAKIVIVLIIVVMMTNVSAQVDIKTEDGTELPRTTYIGEKFTVQVTEDDIPTSNIDVVFMPLRGNAIYTLTDNKGMVSYTPYSTGSLCIRVLDGIDTIEEKTIIVVDEPWVPGTATDPVTTPEPEPTVEPEPEPVIVEVGNTTVIEPVIINVAENETVPITTSTPETNVTFGDGEIDTRLSDTLVVPTPEPTIEDIPEVPVAPKPKATPNSTPGFEAIFTIVGILGIVYLIRR